MARRFSSGTHGASTRREREQSFYAVLTEAIQDFQRHGFDSQERLEQWIERLHRAARENLIPEAVLERNLKEMLLRTYERSTKPKRLMERHPVVKPWTLEMVKPKLRAELDRRILAAASLIKLNRQKAIEQTLQRFAGWATSIPITPSGAPPEGSREAAKQIRKGLAGLSFIERRVVIDQGHKLVSSIDSLVATDGGAIAGVWQSHKDEIGYDYRPEHAKRHGKVFIVRDNYALKKGWMKLAGHEYMDQITAPGEEVYCLPGDSRIPFADRVEVAYRRWYSGELTELVTDSGKTLRATPNHPVLTSQGWVPISAADEIGDVVEIADDGIHVPPVPDEDGAIPRISEVFGALEKTGDLRRVGGLRHQFHGDGTDSNVDIVLAARSLRIDWMTAAEQARDELGLCQADYASLLLRALGQFFHGRLSAAASLMSGVRQLLAGRLAYAGHSDDVRFGTVAQLNLEMLGERAARYTHPSRQAQEAFPFQVRTARIVGIERRKWSGHVYNLQTASGWYVANNIINHNCRCYYGPWLYSLEDLAEYAPECLTVAGREEIKRMDVMVGGGFMAHPMARWNHA